MGLLEIYKHIKALPNQLSVRVNDIYEEEWESGQ